MRVQDRKLKNKVRMSYAVSTVSIAMVLFLLGSVGYLIAGLIGATDRMRGNVEVSVMLDDNADRDAIEKQLKSLDGVQNISFLPKDDAAREFIDASGDDFTEFLDYNPLPDSFTVQVDARDGVAALEDAAAGLAGVKEVVYQRAVVEKIGSNIGKFQLVLLVFGCVLAVISVVLLNNTIRVSVYSKKHIISTMKLVGAESGFIMQPFVRSSVVQGLWAAVIASAMFLLLVAGLGEELPEITLVKFSPLWIMAGMFVAGILISLTFTTITVSKFLRMHTNAIHLY